VLRREKQVRSEVEQEMEIDRLRRKLAKKEAKERQPQLSPASHPVGAPTPSGVGPTEEVLVAVLNREMDRRRLEEEQRAMEARREQQLEADRLRRQSLESTEPRLEIPLTVAPESSVNTRPSGLTASQERNVVDEYYVRGVQSPQASMISKTLGVTTSVASTPVVTPPGVSTQSPTVKPSVAPMLLDTPIKASPVMTTTAQSSRIVADTPTAASSQPILTPDVGTTTPKPVSTAAVPEIPAAAASTAPIVIVRQLNEVRPYDGKTSWKSFREHFVRVTKANQRTTKEEQVQHLALALMGPAAEILRGFDDTADKALDDLWGRLRHRFGTVDECQQAMRDFESHRQSESESLAEFEQVLRTLHREAWPDQSDEQRDQVLNRRFEEGVASAELRQYLRLHHRDLDFRQTTEKARIFAATMGETKAKKSVRFMSESPAPAIHHMTVPTIDLTSRVGTGRFTGGFSFWHRLNGRTLTSH